ncbi:MAG: hypothetical protein MPK62_01920 [Alphaproteobacteria bacterium]|nr:hypothetical protein [Alphaproteobacteria bacterium]
MRIDDKIMRFFNSALRMLQPGTANARFIEGKYDWYFNIEVYSARPISKEFVDWAVYKMGMLLDTKPRKFMGKKTYRTFLTVSNGSEFLKVADP